jgi:HEAT repeat protein
MIRATITAAAFCVCALSSEAQNPTPAPTPVVPPTAKPTRPSTPAPKAKPARLLPSEWSSPDLFDLEDKLAAVRDMRLDFQAIPPMPPMKPMEPMDFMDLSIDPAIEMGMDLDLAPPAFDMDPMMEMSIPMDLDIEMPAMPAMPAMPSMPPMPSMPAIEMAWTDMAPMTPGTPMALAPMARVQGMSPFERQFGGITSDPPKAWDQSDPADSLYRLAREALNRGEYRRAAQLFGEITQKFSNSAYATDARYWRAFALYRLGGQNDLREALNSLQDSGRTYRQASLQTDAPVLATRIRGALAAQGDGAALKAVSQAATQSGAACDREDLAVRIEALNSLGQTDPESTTPILRRLLARRDDCSASLRRAAIYLLGRRTDGDAMNLVMGAARNDPDIRVRAEALRFLAAMPGDQAIATIEEMARTPGNPELQRAAIAALGRSDTPRARQSLRAIVEKTDLDENLRMTALSSIDADRTAENGAYLRGIYSRLETPRLKAAAIRAAARSGGNDNDQWLLSIVRNQSEPVEIRALALRYAGRSGLSIGDLTKMYDVAGDRPLREQLISLYAQRTEPEATDKLMEVARSGTDPDLRRYAISALSRKNDPRTKKLLLEIIDR